MSFIVKKTLRCDVCLAEFGVGERTNGAERIVRRRQGWLCRVNEHIGGKRAEKMIDVCPTCANQRVAMGAT